MPLPLNTPPELQKAISELERRGQRQEHTVFERAPFAAEIPEGGIVLARVSGTSYIYSKILGVRARVALTDVP